MAVAKFVSERCGRLDTAKNPISCFFVLCAVFDYCGLVILPFLIFICKSHPTAQMVICTGILVDVYLYAIVPVSFDEEFLMFLVKFVFEKLVKNSN
jgi:hypothetical protein